MQRYMCNLFRILDIALIIMSVLNQAATVASVNIKFDDLSEAVVGIRSELTQANHKLANDLSGLAKLQSDNHTAVNNRLSETTTHFSVMVNVYIY